VDVYTARDGQGVALLESDLFDEADHAAGVPKHLFLFVFVVGPDPLELVATATDAEGNTSEFSPAITVPEPGAAPLAAGAALAALAVRRRRAC
jgi:hypothetical protein